MVTLTKGTHKDSEANAKGFTKRVYVEGMFGGFDALIRPEEDLDSEFAAWDLDNQEWMTVCGWNCSIDEEDGE